MFDEGVLGEAHGGSQGRGTAGLAALDFHARQAGEDLLVAHDRRILRVRAKYEQATETSLRIAATDPNNPEAELNEAMAASNRIKSDSLSCLRC